MDRYEQLAQLISEGNETKAAQLFKQIALSTARDIYEGLGKVDSELADVGELGGDAADHLIRDVEHEEEIEEDESEFREHYGKRHLFSPLKVGLKPRPDPDINNISPSPKC